jgi:hypothetical protein
MSRLIAAFAAIFFVAIHSDRSNAACHEQVYPVPGKSPVRAGSYQNPACMPGGNLAFTIWTGGYNRGSGQVYTLKPGTSSTAYVGQGINNVGPVALNGRLTYSCDDLQGRDGDSLCISDFDGKNRVQLPLRRSRGSYQEPTFDPTGQYLTFEWEIREASEQGTICVTPVKATSATVPACLSTTDHDKQPAWSPDGKSVIFQRKTAGQGWQIFKAPVANGVLDGAHLQQLTWRGENTDVSWSPHGKKIVYSCGLGNGAGICISDADGSHPQQLDLRATNSYNGAVSWCDDGYVYFESTNGDPDASGGKTVICRISAPQE